VGRAGFEPAKVKPTDLQSVLVGRLSISPMHKISACIRTFYEPMKGLEPPTPRLQITCSSQLSYIGKKPLFLTCLTHKKIRYF
jgi:hypothetical protein